MQKAWKTSDVQGVGAHPTRLSGASLWMLWVAWPALVEARADMASLGLTVCAAGALWWGTRRLSQPQALLVPTVLSRWASSFRLGPGELETAVLLIGVPVPLAIAVTLRPEAVNQQALDTVVILPAALALAWYGASVLRLAQGAARSSLGLPSPLGARPWLAPEPRWAGARRRALLSTWLAGAVAVGIVAPTVGGYERLAGAWRDAAPEGGLLTAVLAGSLGVACVGLFLAESLRPIRPAPHPPGRAIRRAVAFLLLAGVGLLTLWAIG